MNITSVRCFASRGRRGKSSGTTLVEVAVAACVLAFALTSSIVALQSGFKSLDVARGITLSSQIAQSEIERLRMMNWTSLTALSGTQDISSAISSTFSSDPTVSGRFSVTRTIAPVSGDTRTNADQLRQITITVNWTTIDGISHTRVFKTLYSQNGLYDYFYTIARSS